MTFETAPGRLSAIRLRMEQACRAAGRDANQATLIAVSKTFEAAEIRPVLAAGQRAFGENRVQEAAGKWPGLRQEYTGIELHLIGPLQSNKAKEAVSLFDCIHTIDRVKIAQAVAAELARQAKRLTLFIQVNTGAEPQKAGVLPAETASFVEHCRTELNLPVAGLMCIPPVDEEPAIHFAFLSKMARELQLEKLSMGMSADFETALEFGATHVRVGSAIFGRRS